MIQPQVKAGFPRELILDLGSESALIGDERGNSTQNGPVAGIWNILETEIRPVCSSIQEDQGQGDKAGWKVVTSPGTALSGEA